VALRPAARRRSRLPRRHLEAALAASGIAVWDWDVAAHRVRLSAQWGELVAGRARAVRTSLAALAARVHPQDRPMLEAAIARLRAGSSDEYCTEHRVRDARGAWRWILSRGRVLRRDGDGRVRRVAGTNVDITARRLAEERLRESEALVRLVADNVPAMIAYYDARQTLRFANREYAELFGVEVEEVIGWRAADILGSEAAAEAEPWVRRALAGEVVTYERAHRGAGGTMHLQVTLVPRWSPQSEIEGYIVMMTDIGERKRHEAELSAAREEAERANRAKSEFLAHMSHELRTPLNGILGMTEILAASALDEEQRDCLRTIEVCAGTLLALVNDSIDLAKIEAGRMTLECVPFSLREVIEEALRVERQRAAEKGLALEASIAPQVPRLLRGDPVRVRQLVLNLVNNAIKFTAAGHVRVRARVAAFEPGAVRLALEVEDTGIGIAPDKREAIFEAFTQADASTTRRFGGTGLGLAICRRLAALMDGTIGVESEPGRGSTFRVALRLELAEPGESAPTEAPPAPAHRSGLHVLVAEDNPVNRRVLVKFLERLGCRAQCAADGAEAVRRFREQPFDLVLMDVQMPVMDGVEAAARMREVERERGARTPIAALTAHALAGDRERLLAAGMDEHLPKPVSFAALARLLARLCPAGLSSEPAPEGDCGAPPQRPPREDSAPFDLEAALAMCGEDHALLEQLVATFLRTARGEWLRIEQAYAAGDGAALARAAHSLKGGALAIAARPLAALAERLEERARAGELAACGQDIRRLGGAFDALCAALEPLAAPALRERRGGEHGRAAAGA
jgi:PAS domain S-box-containing protein